jgi:hypothetical protein
VVKAGERLEVNKHATLEASPLSSYCSLLPARFHSLAATSPYLPYTTDIPGWIVACLINSV